VNDAVVITCALCGARSRHEVPGIPSTPEEFAAEALRAQDAGASVVHIHARDPHTGEPSERLEHFRDIVGAIRDAAPRLLINLTTGGGGAAADRVRAVVDLKPDFGTLSMGSLTLADLDSDSGEFRYDVAFRNTFADMSYIARAISAAGALVDHELYEAGHAANVQTLRRVGVAVPGTFSLVLGIDGALPANIESLAYLTRLLPEDRHWQIVAPRPGRHWHMIALGLGAGGGIRVGYEDCPNLPDGTIARSNGDLVARAVAAATAIGRPIADAATARAILGVGH
jgi:uncharacterized protein (DUF849 family)